jgi:hypothetical protein
MTRSSAIAFRAFKPEDQAAAKDSILVRLLRRRRVVVDCDVGRDPRDFG